MPAKHEQQLVETVVVPQHYQPATARERRAQAIKRLQIGAGGIAAMLLIVGLANVIMDRARLNEDVVESAPANVAHTPTKGSDPLADIGLVPSPDPEPSLAPPKEIPLP
jgi:hypothetical protein